ncbi:MAG: glycosyltransferase [Halobacteriales archaeon]|nr:glycosyltransferase [Halobacteriales archaeon]
MSDEPSVCVVTQPLSPASEAHVHALLDILSAVTSVSLVTANLPDDSKIRDEHDYVEVSRAGTGEGIVVAALRFAFNQIRMCRAIRQRDEEVVLFFGATSYLLPILFARLVGKTVVLEPRGDVPLSLYLQWSERRLVPSPVAHLLAGSVALLERAGYRSADGIVTYTPSMAEELGLDRYDKKLYPNGARYVDTEKFRPRVPYEDREKAVGFLGRLDEEKNVDDLAEVAKRLPDDTKFIFAGDGSMRGWLEEELADEIKAGGVEMTGWVEQDEVPEVLSRLRLLLLYSEPTEGLPTVILEAFACGTPVYATPVSGVPDVVREGETGFLLGEEHPEAVARRLEEILDSDDLGEMSANCRRVAENEYGFEAAVARYSDLLDEVVSHE